MVFMRFLKYKKILPAIVLLVLVGSISFLLLKDRVPSTNAPSPMSDPVLKQAITGTTG